MNLTEIFAPAQVCSQNSPISSLRKVFELISRLLVNTEAGIKPATIVHALSQREKLGSTYIGHGVAIPHAKLSELTQPIGVLIHLSSALQYDSNVNDQADLIFALLIPEDDCDLHLQVLADLVAYIHQSSFREQLRATVTSEALYASLTRLFNEGSNHAHH